MAHFNHPLERAKALAAKSFEKLAAEDLPPIPENYEIWYAYYSEENPEITRAIDILIAAKQKITSERCQELHQRFLSDNRENERVRQAGDKIQNALKDVNVIVGAVRESTGRFNATLSDASERLEKDPSPQAVGSIVKTVITGTQAMLRQNETLEAQLTASSRVMKDMQRELEMVKKEALTDSLTNLANRKAFDAEIQNRVQEFKASGQNFCLIMMDIDFFKSFNDNYGHQVGDQVLRLVGKTLIDGVKGRDMVARYGGEEFAVLLPETTIEGALKIGDILRKAVASKEVINKTSGASMGRITLSGGAAQYNGHETIDALVERADAALYVSKRNGRNQITPAAEA